MHTQMTIGSLFSGIGGLELGLERAGMKVIWQVELDEFCLSILEKHWPEAVRHNDIKTFDPTQFDKVDVICGGFPCQDISFAGKGDGIDGERSGLWSEMFRVIDAVRPRYILVENVPALAVRGIGRVLGDLASIGFDAEWQSIRASDFTLPHRRERLFIVAYPHCGDGSAWVGDEQDRTHEVFRGDLEEHLEVRVQAADRFAGVDDGISRRLYRPRVTALGNAVVPNISEWIGTRIIEHAAHADTTISSQR